MRVTAPDLVDVDADDDEEEGVGEEEVLLEDEDDEEEDGAATTSRFVVVAARLELPPPVRLVRALRSMLVWMSRDQLIYALTL